MKTLFGAATILASVTAAIAMTIDPVWGLLAAAAALTSAIGFLHCRNQAAAEERQDR